MRMWVLREMIGGLGRGRLQLPNAAPDCSAIIRTKRASILAPTQCFGRFLRYHTPRGSQPLGYTRYSSYMYGPNAVQGPPRTVHSFRVFVHSLPTLALSPISPPIPRLLSWIQSYM